ncbi:hypothetical protein FHG87_017218, partial [Trinorchestia longiramus]
IREVPADLSASSPSTPCCAVPQPLSLPAFPAGSLELRLVGPQYLRVQGLYPNTTLDSSLCDVGKFGDQTTWNTVAKSELETPTRCPIIGSFVGQLPNAPGFCALLRSHCHKPDAMTYVVTSCRNATEAYEHPISVLKEDSSSPPRPLDSIPPPLPPEIQVSYLPLSNSSPVGGRPRTPTEIVVSSDGPQGQIVRLPPPQMTSTVNFNPKGNSWAGSASSKPSTIPGTISLLPSDNRINILSGTVQNSAHALLPQEISVSSNYPPYKGSQTGVIGAQLTIGESKTVRAKRSEVTIAPRMSRAKTTVISFKWEPRTTTSRSLPSNDPPSEAPNFKPKPTNNDDRPPPFLPSSISRESLASPARETQISISDRGSRRPYNPLSFWPTNYRGGGDTSARNPIRKPVSHDIIQPPGVDRGPTGHTPWITEVENEKDGVIKAGISRDRSPSVISHPQDDHPHRRDSPLNQGISHNGHSPHRHGSSAPFSFNSRVPDSTTRAHDVNFPTRSQDPSYINRNDRRLPALHDSVDLPRTVDFSSSSRKRPSSLDYASEVERTNSRHIHYNREQQRSSTPSNTFSNRRRGNDQGNEGRIHSSSSHRQSGPTQHTLPFDLNSGMSHNVDDHILNSTDRPRHGRLDIIDLDPRIFSDLKFAHKNIFTYPVDQASDFADQQRSSYLSDDDGYWSDEGFWIATTKDNDYPDLDFSRNILVDEADSAKRLKLPNVITRPSFLNNESSTLGSQESFKATKPDPSNSSVTIVYTDSNRFSENYASDVKISTRPASTFSFPAQPEADEDPRIRGSIGYRISQLDQVGLGSPYQEFDEEDVEIDSSRNSFLKSNSRTSSVSVTPSSITEPLNEKIKLMIPGERDYRCIGEWTEGDKIYALTYRPDTHTHECFVGAETPDGRVFIREAGSVPGLCERGVQPHIMGMELKQKADCSEEPLPTPTGTYPLPPSRGPQRHPSPPAMPPWHRDKQQGTTKPWKPITAPPHRRTSGSSDRRPWPSMLLWSLATTTLVLFLLH